MEARGPCCPVDLVKLVTMLKDAALPWRDINVGASCDSGGGRGGVVEATGVPRSLSHRPAQPSRLGKSLLPEAIIKVRRNFLNCFIFERLRTSVRPT